MKLTRRALFALLPGGLVWWKPKPKFTTGTAIKHHFDDERYPIYGYDVVNGKIYYVKGYSKNGIINITDEGWE